MQFEILGVLADGFERSIDKFVAFSRVQLADELLKPFKHGAIHVVFVGIETYAVGKSQ